MDTVLLLIAAPLFLFSLGAYIYVKLRMPPSDEDLDDYYQEFEDRCPALAKYTKWSNITFTAVVISMLLLLLSIVI